MNKAIGLVEVRGFASAIEVSDTMAKVANVSLTGLEKAKGNGWMTVTVSGDVGAVKAAVDAGKAKAVENNVYVSSLVIPRPAMGLEKVFKRTDQTAPVDQPIEEPAAENKETLPEVKPLETGEKATKKISEKTSKKPTASKNKKSL